MAVKSVEVWTCDLCNREVTADVHEHRPEGRWARIELPAPKDEVVMQQWGIRCVCPACVAQIEMAITEVDDEE